MDNIYLENQSNLNKEIDENTMDSVIVNDGTHSDFSIRSHIDIDDDDDNIKTNDKGRSCNEHRKFKKGFCKYC